MPIFLQLFLTIFLLIFGLIFILTFTKDESRFFVIFGIVLLLCSQLFPLPESPKDYCKEHQISYELVKTIAEVTGKEKLTIAIALSFAAEGGYDTYDGVAYVMPNATDEEINAVILIADKKQK